MDFSYRINNTASYHREGMKTLGWELTVCNALADSSSPCRTIIRKKSSLGELLYDHLSSLIPVQEIHSLLEIGGGYGFLMRDLLNLRPFTRAAMIDLSPVLLERQKETLRGHDVEFIQHDFFQVAPDFIGPFDLVILNEVVGDFPTLCGVDPSWMDLPESSLDTPLAWAKRFFDLHGSPIPEGPFNLNIGAIEAVAKLCAAGIRYIYLSEHSCEASVPAPLDAIIDVPYAGNPERIPLMGHDEYTIQFSHLEKTAQRFGYCVLRGQYADFIGFDMTDRLNFILTSHSQKDEHEMIRQFIEDCYKYEYLMLIRR
jgi:hypothetical protein